MFTRVVSGLALAVAIGGALFTPTPAKAWWVRPGWGGPVYYGPRPFFYAPRPVYFGPPAYVGAPYGRYWVRAHYSPYGYFVPGHWQ